MKKISPARAAFVVAGVASGVGKTTITAAIIRALGARGQRVQPFKCGPDYIDPGFLSQAAGRPCRNLDGWMVPPEAMLELFHHAAGDADIAVIEGVMGLYDGRRGQAAEGSTAAVAKALRAPVLLVVDAARLSASAAAVVLGYREMDPEINLAGVILNNIGSQNHRRWVSEAITGRTGLPVLGSLAKDAAIALPERHLGLVPADEKEDMDAFLERLDSVGASLDIDAIAGIARSAHLTPPPESRLFPDKTATPLVKLAVARDAAFNFYYEDNLDMLRARGAEIVSVSPLADRELPPDIGGFYIGGGFPEVFAARLAENKTFLKSLSQRANDGMPVYAECGGLVYLSQGVTLNDGRAHDFAGLIPVPAVMRRARSRLGYATARAARDSILLRRGEQVRGHLFHWSDIPLLPDRAAYRLLETDNTAEGFVLGPADNILASYLHLHFAGRPATAARFVAASRRWSPLKAANPSGNTR